MAIKFSQFNTKTTSADVQFIVGYNGLENVKITPNNFLGAFSSLDFIGDTGTGNVNLSIQSFSIVGTASEIETSASAQTLTIGLPDDVTIGNNLTVTGSITQNSNTVTNTFNGDVAVSGTNKYLKIGASNELLLYHHGTDGYITNNTGDLKIISLIADKDVIISADNGSGGATTPYIVADGSLGQVQLNYYGAIKLNTINTGVSITGNAEVSGTVAFGTLQDTGESINISKFVDEADGIPGNDNDTSIPTSAAVKDYVDSQVTAQDLDIQGDTGTGSVDLDSQALTIAGTANQTTTVASGQTITIGLPSSVVITGTYFGTTFDGQLDGTISSATTAVTQLAGDNSTKVATTAYVDSQVTAQDLDFTGDSGTGQVDLDSQALSITGGAVITTTALNQNLDIVHDNVSRTDTTSSSSPAFGGTFTSVDSVSSSSQGHITAINVKTVTLPTPSDATITLDAGTLLNGGGDFTLNQALNETITFNHDSVSRTDTTSTDAPAFGGTFTAVDSVTSSTEGHITAINLKTVTVPTPTYPTVNNNTITISAGSNLNGGGDFTLNQSFDETITVNLDTTITGLTSVTSTTFVGALQGNADTATALAASGNITLTGDTTSTGGPYTYTSGGNVAISTTIADTTVTGKLITGVNLGTAQNIAATDTILEAFGYLQAQITQLPQGLVYNGTWNASTNTPTLTSGSGTTGHFYIVSVAGSTNLDGITDWQVGDWAIFVEAGGTDTWQKIDNTSAITGTGATNKLAKWTGPTTLSTGLVEDDGTTVTIGNSGDLDVTGDADVTGDLAWSTSLTDSTNLITITKFVDEADGIPTNDNDTSIPTSAAVKDYVDSQIGANDTLAEILANGNTTGGTDIAITAGDKITNFTSTGIDDNATSTALTINSSQDATFTGNVILGDTPQIQLGTGNDAQIDHTGSHLFIDNSVGNSYLRNTSTGSIILRNSTGGDIQFDNEFAGNILFNTSNIERMRIASSGNVGIGLTSPSHRLDLTTSDTTWAAAIKNTDTINGYGLFIQSAESASKAILGAYSGSSYKFYVRGDGNVGIGTTSPGYKLDVAGDARVGNVPSNSSTTNYETKLIVKGKNNYSDGINWYGDYGQIILDANSNMTGSARKFMITNALNNTKFAIIRSVDATTDPVTDSTASGVNSGTADFVIDNTGKIGIGTESPSYKLSVVNSGNVASFGDGTRAFRVYTDSDEVSLLADGSVPMKFYTSGVERMRINSSGNVGIGTSSPSQKLHVEGSIRLNSELQIFTGTTDIGQISNSGGALNIQGTSTRDVSLGSDSYPQSVFIEGSNGRVGIGTTSPTADLSVGSTSTSSGDVHLRTTKTTFSMTPSNTDAGGILLDVGWVSGGQGPLKFGIGGSEKMRIDSLGNVNIVGTNSGAGNTSMKLIFDNTDVTVQANQLGGGIEWHSDDGSGSGAGIKNSINTFFTGTGGYTDMRFSTAGTDGNNQERMRIDSSGNVGIGGSAGDGYRLQVVGTSQDSTTISMTYVGVAAGALKMTSNGAMAFGVDNADGGTERMRIDSSGKVIVSNSGATNIGILQLSSSVTSYFLRGGANYGYLSYHTGGYHRWFGSDGAEDMRLNSTGLGIGTTSPSKELDVVGTIKATGADNSNTMEVFGGTTTNQSFGLLVDAGTSATDYAARFRKSDNTVIMEVSGDGNVGIGTTSPSSKLEVNETDDTFNDLSVLTLKRVWSTASTNDRSHGIKFNDTNAALAYIYADRTNSAGNYNGDLVFHTNSGSSGTDTSEKMRITGIGRVVIGSATASANTLTLSGTATEMDITNTSSNGRSYRIESDSTGLFVIKDRTANADRIVLNSSGSVGIGTSSPSQTLEVFGSIYSSGVGSTLLFDTTGALSSNGIKTINDYETLIYNGRGAAGFAVIGNTSIRLGFGTNYTNAETDLYINTSGNVGIGTTSPAEKLDVYGNIKLGSTANSNILNRSDSHWIQYNGGATTNNTYIRVASVNATSIAKTVSIFTDASERMRIDSSGRVGIGTTPDTDADALHLDSSGTNSLKIEGAGSYNLYSYHDSGGVGWATGADTSFTNLLYFDSTNNGIRFYTNSGERMRITSAGAIGIGQTSIPTNTRLNITGTNNYTLSSSSGMGGIKISGTTTGQGNYTSGIGFAFGSGTAGISGVQGTSDADRMGLAFFTHPSGTGSAAAEEKMRIDYLGNVGIGTSSPLQKFVVAEGTGQHGIELAPGTLSYIQAYDRATSDYGDLKIDAETIQFGTNNGAERMRITSAGNVGIGLTNPDAKLEVTGGGSAYTFRGVYSGTSGSYAAGAFQLTGGSTSPSLIDFIYSTTFVGQIVTTGSGVLYQSNSDYRLKENVVQMTGALDRVNQLNPSRFNFIGHEETVDGFLAHELQQVVPQAVTGEKDATKEDGTPKYQGVDHSQIVPLLVGAIKELKQEIETLKAQINN